MSSDGEFVYDPWPICTFNDLINWPICTFNDLVNFLYKKHLNKQIMEFREKDMANLLCKSACPNAETMEP